MAKNQKQRFKAGQTKRFLKSGMEVRLIEPSGDRDWVVERAGWASKGKRMTCKESALVDLEAT